MAREEFRRSYDIQVRFRDVDSLGHVNNAVYFTYLEQARVEYFRGLFGSRPLCREDVPGFVVASARIDYRSPVRLGETVEVCIRASEVGRTSFRFTYELYARPDGAARADPASRLVATGETVQVVYDVAAGKPRRIPQSLREQLEAFEGRTFRSPSETAPPSGAGT